jgi:A/G-specific adenine glycosylase
MVPSKNVWARKPPQDRAHARTSRLGPPNCLPSKERVRDFRAQIALWFEREGRRFGWRRGGCPEYETIVTEVLLQRTRAEVVERFRSGFFREFPDWRHLVRRSSRLELALRPIGLSKRRSTSLRELGMALSKVGFRFPNNREQLEQLPGVGQYVASAIILFVHHGREPLLDSNMARLLERYFGPRRRADIRYDAYLQSLSRAVLARGDPSKLNWGMLDLAAMICVARDPFCVDCPLQAGCRYADLVGVRGWAHAVESPLQLGRSK